MRACLCLSGTGGCQGEGVHGGDQTADKGVVEVRREHEGRERLGRDGIGGATRGG